MKRILLALFALSLIAGAADLTTKSGKVYKNYDVDRATPYGVAIFHDGGSATVPYADLPDELRKKYSEEEKQAAGEVKRLREVARKEAEEKRNALILKKNEEKLYSLKVLQVLNDGLLAINSSGKVCYVTGWKSYNAFVDGMPLGNRMEKYSYFLLCWCVGTYKYTDTQKASRQVGKYTVSERQAIEYYTKNDRKN
mgnify:CR=1 FL=1